MLRPQVLEGEGTTSVNAFWKHPPRGRAEVGPSTHVPLPASFQSTPYLQPVGVAGGQW